MTIIANSPISQLPYTKSIRPDVPTAVLKKQGELLESITARLKQELHAKQTTGVGREEEGIKGELAEFESSELANSMLIQWAITRDKVIENIR